MVDTTSVPTVRFVLLPARKGHLMRLQSGETLRALINQRGLNQSRLAAAAGCSPSFINSMCVGAKSSCSDLLAGRIAEVLGVPTDLIFAPTASRDTVYGHSVHGTAVSA